MRIISSLADILDDLAGSSVAFHSGACESALVGKQLADHSVALSGTRLSTFFPLIVCPYADETVSSHFDIRTLLPGRGLSKAVNEGRARLYRHSLHTHAQIMALGDIEIDILILQVAPQDDRGRYSLGPSVDVMPSVLAQSPRILAVVNPNIPRVENGYFIATDQITWVIEDKESSPGLFPPAVPDDVDRAVAANVLRLLEDGMTFEAGIGAIPEAVMAAMTGLKDVTLHMGLVNDSVLSLLDTGTVRTGVSGKERIVATIGAGSQAFYEKLAREPRLYLRPAIETNDPERIRSFDRFHAVNGALEVDLSGNVNGERLGNKIISCPGGLSDFSIGAMGSTGGKSIIALRSTSRTGGKSTIVSGLSSDRPTLSGNLVSHVVTEYGIAELAGRSKEERAVALRAIAHHDYRNQLVETHD